MINIFHIKYSTFSTRSGEGPPNGGLKSRFHAGFSDKSRPKIAWNSCSRQVYPITLDARLIFHAITQLFSPNSRLHAMKYVQSRHHAFALGGPYTEPLSHVWNPTSIVEG